jgi:CubicO group peptidase (beta-lactamase class C family)
MQCPRIHTAVYLIPFVLPFPWTALRADLPSQADVARKANEYMSASVERDKFSGSVLIARDGKVLFSRGYGMANLEHDVPCTPQTKFRLGSITKQFTAMAILILQERGKLNVDDKVKKYLPDAPAAWDDITIRHLLTHTSGIKNYTGFPDFLKTLRNRITLTDLIAKFKDKPLDFKPGEKFKYSNSGYIVLGKIVETASGKSYGAFVKEAIFDPLEMHDTGYDSAAQVLKHRASGYSRPAGMAATNSQYIDMSIPHAAGALYSTVEDLLKWDRALDTERLVSKKSMDAMFTAFKDGYGYGWMIDRKFDQPRQSHGGGIPGFVTVIERFPAEKLLVVALSNLENARVDRIGNDLAAIALGGRYVIPHEPKAVTIDPGLYDAYAGQYEADLKNGKGKLLLTVTKEGKGLVVQAKGQPRFAAVPEGQARFYLKGPEALVEFVKGPKGAVTHLTFLQDNQTTEARRIEPAAPAKNGEPSKSKTDSKPVAPADAGSAPRLEQKP